MGHLYDLRAEVAAEEKDPVAADAWLAALAVDWRRAPLSEQDRALCLFADKLTRDTHAMTAADLEPLRAAGLDDRGIHDAAQVVAYFNYINRLADALGVDPEPWMPPLPGLSPR